MNKDQLLLGIIAASEIIQQKDIFVIGSQAILGTYNETELPEYATLSRDLDLLPRHDIHDILSDMLHTAGPDSPFDLEHNFYLDGVSEETAKLPRGWEKRVVEVKARSNPPATGWCLDKHDLCVAKLAANRDKDRKFVQSLIEAGLVDPIRIRQLLGAVPAEKLNSDHRRIARTFIEVFISEKQGGSKKLPSASASNGVEPAKTKRIRCRAKDPVSCKRHD